VLAKTFNLKSAQALSLLDKIPTFVSKEKSKEKFLGRVFTKKITGNVKYLTVKHSVEHCRYGNEYGIVEVPNSNSTRCSNGSLGTYSLGWR
jgi:hypothetical protein